MKSMFTLLPMSQRISLSAGDTYQGSVTVANPVDAESDFSYNVVVTPYNVVGENYDADIANITTHSQIANWITIENPTGTLKPNEHAVVNFTINVPENVPAGGQYATILVSEDGSENANAGFSVSTTLQLASVIYADISGERVQGGTVEENNVPSFSFDPNIELTAIIKNEGNTHSDALFDISITNIFNGETIATNNNDNKYSEIIMPESSRYITHRVDNLPVLGFLHVNQTIYFNDIAYTTEKDLIVCPAWFIFLVLLTVMSAVAFVISRIHHHRKLRKKE